MGKEGQGRFDPSVFGKLGGGDELDPSKLFDKRDIQNSSYKKYQDRLEAYLANPKIPASYKESIKRVYSVMEKAK